MSTAARIAGTALGVLAGELASRPFFGASNGVEFAVAAAVGIALSFAVWR